jgi:hypothetical protein
LYVPAFVDPTVPEQRILEQAVRLRGGAVTGWAACRMHGAAFFDGREPGGRTPVPVPLNCGPFHQIRRRPGDDLLRDMLYDAEVVLIAGVRCATVERATFDAMRFARNVREAVVALDMMCAAQLVTVDAMRAYISSHPIWTGVEQCRQAVELASAHSRSPQETRLRLVWVLDAGCRRPLVNRPVFDLSGNLLGIPDLLDPVAGVVGEYDGEDHRGAVRHSDDVTREGRFRDHHLEVCRVTSLDLRNRTLTVDRIHAAFRRAQPPARRTWTLEAPAWWTRAGVSLPATG